MKLTKRTIEKLQQAPVELKLYNGTFYQARVAITNNKVKYELRVQDTHELLREYCHIKEPRYEFVVWETMYSGTVLPVPDELKEISQKLLEHTKMTDEQAMQIRTDTEKAIVASYKEMGWM